MKTFIQEVKAFFSEEEGLTIVEYAVGGSLVAVGAVFAFEDLGESVCGVVGNLATVIDSSVGATTC